VYRELAAGSRSLTPSVDAMLAFIESFAGVQTAGIVQFAAEYYPSAKLYGGYHKNPKAPAYLKREA